MAAWADYLAENRSRFLNEYFDLLRIPSISALPEHAGDVQRRGLPGLRRFRRLWHGFPNLA